MATTYDQTISMFLNSAAKHGNQIFVSIEELSNGSKLFVVTNTTYILKKIILKSFIYRHYTLFLVHLQGTMECLLAVAFVNLAFALFGGQPLIIMGSTGPVLVLEIIIYDMCRYVESTVRQH